MLEIVDLQRRDVSRARQRLTELGASPHDGAIGINEHVLMRGMSKCQPANLGIVRTGDEEGIAAEKVIQVVDARLDPSLAIR